MHKYVHQVISIASAASLLGCSSEPFGGDWEPDSEPIAEVQQLVQTPCPATACPDVTEVRGLSLWPSGVIYYQFTTGTTVAQRTWVRQAMNDWENLTNAIISFVPSSTAATRLTIFPDQGNPVTGGGYGHSYTDCVNYPPNHATPCGIWAGTSNIYHELGHSIGLIHHWARYDRRHYMRINKTNSYPECQGVQPRTSGNHDFGPFDFKSTEHYGATFPDHTRWDGSALCAGQNCSSQACVATAVPGCPGGFKCPTCAACNTAQPFGYPTQGDASTVVEMYQSLYNPRWKKFRRAVNEDTGAGVNQPYNYDLAPGVTIGATRSLSAVARGNVIEVHATGSNGHVYEKAKTGSSWLGWFDLGLVPGTGSVSDPAAVSWSSSRVDIVVRRGSVIYIKTWDGAWHPWQSLGTPASAPASAPSIASWGPNRLDVVVRGSDDQLYWKKCTANCNGSSGTWSGWSPAPGGTFRGKPAAVSRTNGVVDVFVHGMDDRLWATYHVNDVWGGYYLVSDGGTLKWDPSCPDCCSPAVTSRGTQTLDVFVRGWDDQVWMTTWSNGPWSGYNALGGILRSSPASIPQRRATDRIDLFANMPEERTVGTLRFGPWWKEYTE